jgi:hypothetical protein
MAVHLLDRLVAVLALSLVLTFLKYHKPEAMLALLELLLMVFLMCHKPEAALEVK